VSLSVSRFAAEHRDRPGEARAVIATGLGLKLAVGLVACGALALLADPIATAYGKPELAWPLRAIALAVFGQSLVLFFQRAFTGLGKVSRGLTLIGSESFLEAGTSVALVALGAGAAGAAWGRAIGYVFGAVLGAVLMARLLGRGVLRPDRDSGPRARSLARYAGALFVIDGAFTLFNEIDALVIGAYLSVASVGFFQAPMRLAWFLHYPGLAVANGITPQLAEGVRTHADLHNFATALRLMLLLQGLLIAPVVVWAEPIVRLLLGPEYLPSAEVLRALAPFILLSGIAPLLALGVNYLGEARRRIPLAIGAVALNLALDLILVPEIGIVAGAIGTDAAYLLYVPAHVWLCRRMIGLEVRPLALAFVRLLLASTAMGLVLWGFGTSELGAAEWAAGGTLGTLAYVFVLIVSGELSPREIATGSRRMRNRVGRPRS
jgi:O-antigen/teichoic acid export membrane protein